MPLKRPPIVASLPRYRLERAGCPPLLVGHRRAPIVAATPNPPHHHTKFTRLTKHTHTPNQVKPTYRRRSDGTKAAHAPRMALPTHTTTLYTSVKSSTSQKAAAAHVLRGSLFSD